MSGAGFAERLARGTVLGAEGYVFELERRGYIKAGPFVPEVVLDFPEAVRELHREFLRAGSDVMVALTYYAHREKLRDVGREGDLEAMNRQAVRIAREVAAEGGALVAGNVCNTWAYDPGDPSTRDAVRAMYAEQLAWAAQDGIDFVISPDQRLPRRGAGGAGGHPGRAWTGCSRWRSSRSAAPASRWRTSRAQRATSGSTT
jgi:betaine-homocysteine S-methyltransferase